MLSFRNAFPRKFFLYNPALLLSIFFLVFLILVVICNHDKFVLENADLFTLLYAYPLLILIHLLLRFNDLRSSGNTLYARIFESLKFITTMYLPYLIIAAIYENLVLFNQAFNTSARLIDFSLMQLDASIFGFQPTIWLEKLIHPVAVEYFMIAYSMFFIYPFFYLIYLLQKNEIEIFQKVMLAQLIALIISLTSFLLFPAIGPRFTLDPASVHAFENITGYSKKLVGLPLPLLNGDVTLYALQADLWNHLERIQTDCFPSMHVGLCLICLIYALRYRKIFKHKNLAVWFWIVGVTSLVISTVYLRYHWVIDAIAGVVLAITVYYLSEMIYKLWQNLRVKHGHININAPWLRSNSDPFIKG